MVFRLNIGCHLSTSKGYEKMGKVALEIGANTFQFFTRNPRGGRAKALDPVDLEKLKKIMDEHHFAPLLAHAPYTLNMCSKDEKTRDFAKMMFADDLNRMEQLPCTLYNFHPGSHTGQGVEKGIHLITEILNEVMFEGMTTVVLLETMSGKGSEIGKTFEEIRDIINGVELHQQMGVCLDTCHIYSAGYDIVNDLDGVLEKFDDIIGLNRLKAIHLNDSMTPFNSHKDRHACIGEGEIGLEAIMNLVNHPKLKDIPFLLETPNEIEGYEKEIVLLKA